MAIVTPLRNGLLALALFAVPAASQEPAGQGITRSVELPSHRALARIRDNEETVLAPFTTDGCSGGLSSAWTIVADRFPAFAEAHDNNPPWEECCVVHDRAYHAAGPASDPEASFAARTTADRALETCVIDTGRARVPDIAAHYQVAEETVAEAYVAIARAMHLAVRLGGAPCSGLPWRWGYGYPHCFTLPRDFRE